MSKSQARVILPPISVPQKISRDPQLLGFLIEDLTALIASWDDIVDDLLFCTDARALHVKTLWIEATMSIEAFRRVWIEQLRQEVQGVVLEPSSVISPSVVVASGPGKLPALEQLFRELEAQVKVLSIKMAFFRYEYSSKLPLPESMQSKKISCRPVVEILFEAILRTRMAVEDLPFKVLESLPQERASRAKNPLQSDVVPLLVHKWVQLHCPGTNKRRESGALRIGYPPCVSVVLPGGDSALTGVSRIKLGSLSDLQVYMGSVQGHLDLQSWFRRVRQDRFDSDEQKVIDTLVMREIDAQRQEFKRLKMPRPSEKAKHKISVMSDKDALRGSVKYMVDTASSRLPSLLATVYKKASRSHLGQSYDGQSLVFKRKCPVCTGIYVFPVSHTPNTPHDFARVAEVDRNLPENALRGACAEAITFVRSIVALGLLKELSRELGLA